MTKKTTNQTEDHSVPRTAAELADALDAAYRSPDIAKAVRAFAETIAETRRGLSQEMTTAANLLDQNNRDSRAMLNIETRLSELRRAARMARMPQPLTEDDPRYVPPAPLRADPRNRYWDSPGNYRLGDGVIDCPHLPA
jgi:DNA repair ATPase RecN